MVERDGELQIETPNANRVVVFDPDEPCATTGCGCLAVFGLQSTLSGLWGVAGQGQVADRSGVADDVGRVHIEGRSVGSPSKCIDLDRHRSQRDRPHRSADLHLIADRSCRTRSNWRACASAWFPIRVELLRGQHPPRDLRTKKQRIVCRGGRFALRWRGDRRYVLGCREQHDLRSRRAEREVLGEHDLVGFGPFLAAGTQNRGLPR